MHSLIPVDAKGLALAPCQLWSDNRAVHIASELKKSKTGSDIFKHTGTPVHPMAPLSKIAWLRENQLLVFKRAAYFLGVKEYLVHRLSGQFITDYSIASATGLFDAARLVWYEPSLEFAGIEAERLPLLVPPVYVLPGIAPKIARYLGIAPTTPFVVGASDGCLANLGAGALSPDCAVLTIGTSGALRMTVHQPVYDPKQRIFNYLLVDNQYVTGGGSNSGAVIYEWFVRQFLNTNPSSATLKELQKSLPYLPAGSEGLLFLPYLLGERAPIWSANAQGVFFGLHTSHRLVHLHKAVLEGILLNHYLIGQALETSVSPISRLIANGGFARSEVWLQMTADIFGVPVETMETEESSAFGAMLLGIKALQLADGYGDILARKKPLRRYEPDEGNYLTYRQSALRFHEIYEHLAPVFENQAL
jgi:gluconokinase